MLSTLYSCLFYGGSVDRSCFFNVSTGCFTMCYGRCVVVEVAVVVASVAAVVADLPFCCCFAFLWVLFCLSVVLLLSWLLSH